MADYGDVERVSAAFQSAISLLHQVRNELEKAGYGEDTTRWFVVSDGNKPWNFYVDWLGVTYRLAVSAKVDTEHRRFSLKNATLSVSRLSENNPQTPSYTPISDAQMHIRHASICFRTQETGHGSEVVYPQNSAEQLFFSMIGLPLEIW